MRRFIAGAVCPDCRAVDRIVVEQVDGERRRRCVSCGHTDAQLESSIREPSTRLDTRARPRAPATAVRILTPPVKNDEEAD
jgi:hypothetical protein